MFIYVYNVPQNKYLIVFETLRVFTWHPLAGPSSDTGDAHERLSVFLHGQHLLRLHFIGPHSMKASQEANNGKFGSHYNDHNVYS